MSLKEKLKLYLEEVRARKYDVLQDSGFLMFEQNSEYLKKEPSSISEETQYDIDNGKFVTEDFPVYCKK